MELTPKQLIDQLYGPPKTEGQKKLSDFKKKGVPKPEKPESLEYSELFEKLNLEQQYETRINSLQSANILEKLSNGELGIKGINNQEYPIPTLNQIKEKIAEKEEILKTKIEQGFTQIMIVPFAMPITELANKYKEAILKHHKNKTLRATNGDKLKLDENQPLYVWGGYDNANTENKIVYYPQEFNKENHQGKTKQQLLETQLNQGWQILLIEDLPDLPAEGQGQEISGRKQLESNQAPIDYLKQLQENPIYQNEQGLTPEDWLTYAITHLEETNQVIDDWDVMEVNGEINWNLGGYFPDSDYVSCGAWNRVRRRANLGRNGSGNRYSNGGVRFGVSVI